MELLSKYYYIHLLVGSTALFLHSDCVISLTPTARARCLAQLCECLLQPALPGRSLAASLRDRREGNAAVGPLVSGKATSRSGFCLIPQHEKGGDSLFTGCRKEKSLEGSNSPWKYFCIPFGRYGNEVQTQEKAATGTLLLKEAGAGP